MIVGLAVQTFVPIYLFENYFEVLKDEELNTVSDMFLIIYALTYVVSLTRLCFYFSLFDAVIKFVSYVSFAISGLTILGALIDYQNDGDVSVQQLLFLVTVVPPAITAAGYRLSIVQHQPKPNDQYLIIKV